MIIGIIDVGIGNIGSLRGALYNQGFDLKSVKAPSDMADITHLILPGVGSFAVAMQRLHNAGLIDSIRAYSAQNLPLMGICLGMQLLADCGVEGGKTEGLGLVSGHVALLDIGPEQRLPHVGWNEVLPRQQHPLLKGIRAGVDFYFVHSYYLNAEYNDNVIGITEYGVEFPSFVANGNVVGVQFHPEKSQRNGLRLLENFCFWNGTC